MTRRFLLSSMLPSVSIHMPMILTYIIGGITGAIEISITFPTEYVKTVM